MIPNLLFGLPGDRPGGLALTLILAVVAGSAALVAGLAYAAACARFPRASIPVQASSAFVRGVPLILLVFLLAQSGSLSLPTAGLFALLVYSFVHVGEILRSFLCAYPRPAIEQARAMGMGAAREWLLLRLPWTLRRALAALTTHWVSLLKDTGALVVLGIGELTTVAKVLSESSTRPNAWVTILLTAGALYLGATICLIGSLQLVARRLRLD